LETIDQTTNPFPWQEYRLFLLAALMGVVGGLSAQLFVFVVNLDQTVLLVGFAGYVLPEPRP
jgi:hypothetical protein